MTSTPAITPAIVVGVGPEEVESALAFAAAEAIRARCGLHLVHAVHVSPPGPENALLTAVDGTVCGMVALEDLVEDLVGTVRDGTHRG